MRDDAVLIAGLVIDGPGEGTRFASAGGLSDDPRVQAVYWRCLAVLFYSARLAMPGLRLVLCCTAPPPSIDERDLAALFARLEVEVRIVPLTTRLAAGPAAAWGNVLYLADIFDDLAQEADDTALCLVDSDVIVTGRLDGLFDAVCQHDFVTYPLSTSPGEDINGMDRRAMTAAATALDRRSRAAPIAHLGGELIATTPRAWRAQRAAFQRVLDMARQGAGPFAAVRTEEHVWSIVLATLPTERVAPAGGWIKRMWTTRRHRTVAPGDERLPLWHLPSEKRAGIARLYAELDRVDFDLRRDPVQFARRAGLLCGVPGRSPLQELCDLARRLPSKLTSMLR